MKPNKFELVKNSSAVIAHFAGRILRSFELQWYVRDQQLSYNGSRHMFEHTVSTAELHVAIVPSP